MIYNLTVTNNGNVSDTFNVAVTGNSWATTPLPSPIGPIAAGATVGLSVDVFIQAEAANDDSDTATVTLTSQGDGTVTASSILTTTALVAPNFDNVLVNVIVSMVIGALFGWASGRLAGALTKSAAPAQ